MTFRLKSAAFNDGESIPKQYTCDGADTSVPLSWTDPPEGTQSFALVVDDPDAPSGTWVHWVLYDLPGEARELPGDVPPTGVLDDGSRQGPNDFRRIGYGGPCPPPGPAHRYVFTLYALNDRIGLQPGSTKPQLLRAMKGHILGQAKLSGVYKRWDGS